MNRKDQLVYPRPEKRKVRFRGICQAAETLNVHRVYLWAVLTGRYRNPALEAAYYRIRAKKTEA